MEEYGFIPEDYQKTNEKFFSFTGTTNRLNQLKKLGFLLKARYLYLRTLILLRIFDQLNEE